MPLFLDERNHMFTLNKERMYSKEEQLLSNIQELLTEMLKELKDEKPIVDVDKMDRKELFALAKDKIPSYQLMKTEALKQALKDYYNGQE